jgi:hypothetical protein
MKKLRIGVEKMKKCPYCGKRISYVSRFASRRKGDYVCKRCHKESRVVISNFVFLGFGVAAAIAVAILAYIYLKGMINNPFSIALVAIPLIAFVFVSPYFVKFEPFKKYKKSMEARKAGIEYSDKQAINELENPVPVPIADSSFETDKFQINTDIFNKIKAERNVAKSDFSNSALSYSQNEIIVITDDEPDYSVEDDDDSFVPIINNISENHSSSDDTPLKKLHSEEKRSIVRTHHYIDSSQEKKSEHMVETKKHSGNKYSANRKF